MPTPNDHRNSSILLVEDNQVDIRLTKEAMAEANIKAKLDVVMDGEEATDFLYKRGRHAQATTPDLIVLDLNLPKKGGREVLSDIKSDPILRRIPVVVLSTSAANDDVVASY